MLTLLALLGGAPVLLPYFLAGAVAAVPAVATVGALSHSGSADAAEALDERLSVACGAPATLSNLRVVGRVRTFSALCAGRTIEFALEPADGEPRFMTARVRGVDAEALDMVAISACPGTTEVLHDGAVARIQRCETGERRLLIAYMKEGADLHIVAAVLP